VKNLYRLIYLSNTQYLNINMSASLGCKLHLGCGPKPLPGWVNIDILPDRGDVQDDITKLEHVPDGVASIIYASHVLEHTTRHTWQAVLALWVRKLQTGGTLRIAVPDFAAAAQWYLAHGNIQDVMGLISGGQRDAYDYHNVIFDTKSLSAGMEAAGCVNVRKWDWKTTEHADYDDYSQAYLPHMDKDHGMLMSLNLEGKKL